MTNDNGARKWDEENTDSNDDESTEALDKTSIVASETLKVRLKQATETPPAIVLLMGPARYVGKQWHLSKDELNLGRSFDCDIFLEDRSVSKRHARIIVTDNQAIYEDMGSTNGSEINGKPITPYESYPLRNNDHVKAGNVIFKFLEKGNLETVANNDTYDRTQLDPLTQIYNKGALLSAGEEIFRRAKTADANLTVIVFDLDNFKILNDTYGHQAGDYVLREMSALVQNQLIRSEDFFARFGGEEFCLIMSGAPLQRGVEVAERIRMSIDKYPFKYADEELKVTVSMGVASIDPTMESWSDLFEKADQASYLSKKGGKNRVSTI